MKDTKLKAVMLFECIRSAIKDWRIVCSGQNKNAEILQIAHRLEKGLTIANPRPLWGWEKAERLKELILNNYSTEAQIGKAVLYAFVKRKEQSDNEQDKVKSRQFMCDGLTSSAKGGVSKIVKQCYDQESIKSFISFFNSRHSIRTFNNSSIDETHLQHALELALKCPSACIRQPFHVYVLNGQDKRKYITQSDSINADKYLYISGDISSFTPDEFNDWHISPAIFAAYLTMTLEIFGIGSCIMRKDLVRPTIYNKTVKKVCDISDNEKLILEIAIGYYDNDIIVPDSQRKGVNDIVTFININNLTNP